MPDVPLDRATSAGTHALRIHVEGTEEDRALAGIVDEAVDAGSQPTQIAHPVAIDVATVRLLQRDAREGRKARLPGTGVVLRGRFGVGRELHHSLLAIAGLLQDHDAIVVHASTLVRGRRRRLAQGDDDLPSGQEILAGGHGVVLPDPRHVQVTRIEVEALVDGHAPGPGHPEQRDRRVSAHGNGVARMGDAAVGTRVSSRQRAIPECMIADLLAASVQLNGKGGSLARPRGTRRRRPTRHG
ncbi:MAG: hypothetical protein U1F52_00170 [Burkholderiales bacterium]